MTTLANGLKFKHKGEVQRLNRRLEELNGDESLEGMLAELMEVKLHLNMEMDKEERYWEQRERVNWLQMGKRFRRLLGGTFLTYLNQKELET
ncbi:Endonuclease/exonuclease/phosphatase [Gossypium australe]|uniref:Endonuclease/exonuclease/phosphatase n=1 Tax=Gossypium australe TaxID=47621 RepID=A0A5B6W601_9ROSI|nr:Endonuclease/exonuclease/phosphatase [Gossypium australe]